METPDLDQLLKRLIKKIWSNPLTTILFVVAVYFIIADAVDRNNLYNVQTSQHESELIELNDSINSIQLEKLRLRAEKHALLRYVHSIDSIVAIGNIKLDSLNIQHEKDIANIDSISYADAILLHSIN